MTTMLAAGWFEALWFDTLVEVLREGDTDARIWYCPARHLRGGQPHKPIVDWRGDVAYCLYPDCGRTSADPH